MRRSKIQLKTEHLLRELGFIRVNTPDGWLANQLKHLETWQHGIYYLFVAPLVPQQIRVELMKSPPTTPETGTVQQERRPDRIYVFGQSILTTSFGNIYKMLRAIRNEKELEAWFLSMETIKKALEP